MRNILAVLPLLSPTSALAANALNFTAQIEPWQAQCPDLPAGQVAHCGNPAAAAAQPGTVALSLALAAAAGDATEADQNFSLTGGAVSYSGKISLYSVYPAASTGTPEYIQVRIDLISPVRATCAESVRLRTPMELPPVICAAFGATAADGSASEAGVTISFGAP